MNSHRRTIPSPQFPPQTNLTPRKQTNDLRATNSQVSKQTSNKPANLNRRILDSCNPQETRKSRRGRPELSPEERREHRVSVMVTARELLKLKELARLEGTSISSAVRRLLSRSL